jgi:cytochrome P450 family 6
MLVVCLFAASIAFAIWLFWQQTFFRRHNIPYVQTNILLGGLSDSLLGKCGFFENVRRLYTSPEAKDVPFFGFFIFQRPALVIKDPELIKRIMVKDFNSFNNRVHASCEFFMIPRYSIQFNKILSQMMAILWESTI